MVRNRQLSPRPPAQSDSVAATITRQQPDRVAASRELWGTGVRLPQWEVRLYVCGWVGAVSYSIYSVYAASREYKDRLNDYFLVRGWRILGSSKDTSNFEWDFWSGWFLEIWPWFLGHIMLSQFCRWRFMKGRNICLTLYAFLTLYFLLGLRPLILFIGHACIMYLMTFVRFKVAVWIMSLILLTSLNLDVTVDIMKRILHNDPFEKKFYLLLFTLAMTNLRYTGAALEVCERRTEIVQITNNEREQNTSPANKSNKKENSPIREEQKTKARRKAEHKELPAELSASPYMYSFVDFIVYVFYLPLAFTGPVMPFDKFHLEFIQSPTGSASHVFPTCWVFVKRCLRIAFWIAVIEFSLHFLYFNCIQLDGALLQNVSLWALAGTGFCHGQFFMVKYVILFGLPSLIAGLDGVETPQGPKCIARIHLYSDMWKYFDRGLYTFLMRYIYVPLGGSRKGLPRQLLASGLCFVFVYYWHGAEDYLLVWAALNMLGITVETLGGRLGNLPEIQGWEGKLYGAGWSRRVRALLSVPLLAMSAIAIFNFFGGRQVGMVFFQRLVIEGYPTSTLTTATFLYCCVQTSIEFSLREKLKLS